MADFDPIKAQKDIVEAASNAHLAMRQFLRKVERDLGEIEAVHGHAVKVEAWMRADLDGKREHLHKLIWEAENAK